MASQKKSSLKKRKFHFKIFFLRTISLLSIFLGSLLLIAASFEKFSFAQIAPQESKGQNESSSDHASTLKPVKLFIPKIDKALSVSAGSFIDERWVISEDGVSFLTTSAVPGTLGNSVFYGHNRKEILGGLPNLKVGEPIYIVMDNGEFVKYEVYETRQINPKEVEILNQSTDSRLTIYTCSGFLDSARFVVFAS